MSRLSILALAVLAVTAAGAAPPRDQEGKTRVIVLFGARWCAPCMAEYRDLADLAAAAAPDHITLAWIDRSISPPAMMSEVRSLPAEEARRLARATAGDGYGLPFSVMFDAAGLPCAVWRFPLRPNDLVAVRAKCVQSRH